MQQGLGLKWPSESGHAKAKRLGLCVLAQRPGPAGERQKGRRHLGTAQATQTALAIIASDCKRQLSVPLRALSPLDEKLCTS